MPGAPRDAALAMATGTGKTKTCIALIYRLLKAQALPPHPVPGGPLGAGRAGRQRVQGHADGKPADLRRRLRHQGAGGHSSPTRDTAVHIATVQGMVQRVLYAAESAAPPPVDQYDCIVVDECHRGYLLDRELSDTELTFRGFDDYISKYRRVLDYFDAVKIGLTATPALHTAQIFGLPIYHLQLSGGGHRRLSGRSRAADPDQYRTVQPRASLEGGRRGARSTIPTVTKIDLFNAPDEIKLEVEDFNRKVITEDFNRVVCEYLATEIDPSITAKDPDLLRQRRPCRPRGRCC